MTDKQPITMQATFTVRPTVKGIDDEEVVRDAFSAFLDELQPFYVVDPDDLDDEEEYEYEATAVSLDIVP
jgi:hypothetical protein